MVAIKDMEMPKCCFGNNPCPLANGETGTCNKLEFQEDCDTTEERPSNCPLVEIGTCKDCKHRDPEDKKCDCGHSIVWQTPRPDNWYCADFEKRGNKNG